jgi:uncharacterized protein YecT (DUF1311 family)
MKTGKFVARFAFVSVALLMGFASRPTRPWAQSFDCAEASTPSERLVCDDRKLAELDLTLADEVKKALAAAPAQRERLLGDERRWVAERDNQCLLPSQATTADDRLRAASCLAAAYRDRISTVQSFGSKRSVESYAGGKSAMCQRLAERYRALLEANPQASFRKYFYAAGPLDILAAAKSAGVTIAQPVAQFDEYSRRKIVDWAKRPPQSFSFAADLLQDLDKVVHSQLRVDRLPGANYFAASVIEGSAACYSAVYFETKRDRARRVGGPDGWGNNGDSCGVTRSFGRIDSVSVAFEEAHDYTPSLVSSVSVTPWMKNRFASACVAIFEFAPRFNPHGTYNSWDESCDGTECEDLRRAALALVEETQKNPLEAQKARIAALTPSQLEQFATLKKLAGADSDPGASQLSNALDPAAFTDSAPYRLPLVQDGQVYLASLGLLTIGWRVFSDWGVKLERLENSQLRPFASFAIGMTKGHLEKFSVK